MDTGFFIAEVSQKNNAQQNPLVVSKNNVFFIWFCIYKKELKMKKTILQRSQKEYAEFVEKKKKDQKLNFEPFVFDMEEHQRMIEKIMNEDSLIDPNLRCEKERLTKGFTADFRKPYDSVHKASIIKKDIESPLSKSQKISLEPMQQKAKEIIGDMGFEKLKDIYEAYSAYSATPNMMENHEFQKFMKDYELYTEKVTKVSAELMFKKKNQLKSSMNFSRFIEILYEISGIEFSSIRNKDHAFDDFIREKVLKKGVLLSNSTTLLDQSKQYESWFTEIDGFDIKEYLESKKSLFSTLFRKYEQNVPSFGIVIPLKNFTKFCQDLKITPDLLSTPECIKVY